MRVPTLVLKESEKLFILSPLGPKPVFHARILAPPSPFPLFFFSPEARAKDLSCEIGGKRALRRRQTG